MNINMEVRQKLRQRYQQIIKTNQQIKQMATQAPTEIAENLTKRRQNYQNIVNQLVLQIKTAKSFAEEKQKQLTSISNQNKLIVKWAAKRGKTFAKQLQRQQSLKQTFNLVKQTKLKMMQHKRKFQEVKKDLSIEYAVKKIGSNQYENIVKSMREEKMQRFQNKKSGDMFVQNPKRQNEQQKRNQMQIENKQRVQSTSLDQKKGSKKHVSFIGHRSQTSLKKVVKLDIQNDFLQVQVVGRQGLRSVKNIQLSFKKDKEIFVPKNKNQSKEVKQALSNFNYHKDIKRLQNDIAKIN